MLASVSTVNSRSKKGNARMGAVVSFFLSLSMAASHAGVHLVWFPDPSTHKIRACAYDACACEKKGLVQNYTLTRALEF